MEAYLGNREKGNLKVKQSSTTLSYCRTEVIVLPPNVEEPHAEESADGMCIIHWDIKPADGDTQSLIGACSSG